MLKEEVSVMSRKLEELQGEKKEMGCTYQRLQKEQKLKDDEVERIRLEAEKLEKDRDGYRTESQRLKHRISYLEEQVFDRCETEDSIKYLICDCLLTGFDVFDFR